jgi:hypothetical protein
MRTGRKRASKDITPSQALTVDMREELRKARRGDKSAAQGILAFIHDSLTIEVPLTDPYRQYLLDILKAGRDGSSMDKAAGLARGGRSAASQQTKTLVAYVVQELMKQGNTLDVAAEEAVPFCNQVIRDAKSNPSAWSIFQGRLVSADQARKWYVEVIGSDCSPAIVSDPPSFHA